MKHLLFYSGATDGAGESLKKILMDTVPKEDIEICRTIHDLAYKILPLRTITDSKKTIHVLIATSEQELLDLYSVRDLLTDLRVILIAPNRNDETVKKAHDMYPRYLGYLDDNFKEIGEVFAKMLKNGNKLTAEA